MCGKLSSNSLKEKRSDDVFNLSLTCLQSLKLEN